MGEPFGEYKTELEGESLGEYATDFEVDVTMATTSTKLW
jgi:hypothetical protein